MKNTIILSLGGSLIVPDSVDTAFLKAFKKVVDSYIKKGFKFVLICGGGKLARNYQDAAKKLGNVSDHDLDCIGIKATKLNAQVVKTLFEDSAEKVIVDDPTKPVNFKKPILVASGWKPGCSTDYDAVLLAKQLNISTIINMSNIDYVYDSDPRKNKNAKPLHEMSWSDFKQLVGDKWTAGLNAPFDPIAAKEASKNNYKVFIIGKDLNNFSKVLDEKEFKGTVISQ